MENRVFTGYCTTYFVMGIQCCCMPCFAMVKYCISDG
ncbi:hypothetical protein BXY41_110162 [Lacrimispora xylanisolvens]|uniref:Uncharacterized protein n=1 Tax=Lacrimispora xylanisolvens TaxID=384636 RepID=A0A2S6HPJ0_9FIRM|nr:hypothetical protein BXY41_110162 [Hungatella xylanolytica]